MQHLSRQYWLVNLQSGGGEGERLAHALDGLVTVVPIDFANLQAQLGMAAGFDKIVVAAGDGTVAAILTSEHLPNVPVATVPLGTANDLGREMGVPRVLRGKRWQEYPAVIDGWREERFSTWVLQCGDIIYPFCNYVSLGFEGAVVADFHSWRSRTGSRSRILNRIAYAWFGLARWFTRLVGVEVSDGGDRLYRCTSTRGLIFANIKSHMGCGAVTAVSNSTDDVIEAIIASSPFDYLRMVASPLKLLPALPSVVSGQKLYIRGIPVGVPIQVDGEARPGLYGDTATVAFRRFVRVLTAHSNPRRPKN